MPVLSSIVPLNSSVLPVEGMIDPILASRNLQLNTLYFSYDSTIPKIEIPNLELVYIERIQVVIDILSGQQLMPFVQQESRKRFRAMAGGHAYAKRALEITASGEHYVLMDSPLGLRKKFIGGNVQIHSVSFLP
jgi:magnesium chelatase family protein